MRSRIAMQIDAPFERIFPLAAEVERWPERLPHYRFVRRLDDVDGERRFAMGARRGPIPVRWEAIERPLPEARRIEFTHTGGVTKGMDVAWRFEEHEQGWEVSIEHDLRLRWPLIGGLAAERVIAPQFIEAIARRTLQRVKALAEGTE